MNFNIDMNNVRQRRTKVVIFNVEFHNIGQCQRNVVKNEHFQKEQETKSFQIECTELRVPVNRRV